MKSVRDSDWPGEDFLLGPSQSLAKRVPASAGFNKILIFKMLG